MVSRGPFYQPGVPPAGGGALGQWAAQEFERIAQVLQQGALHGLMLDVIGKLPEKPREGMVVFFRSGTISIGSAAGCYEFKGGAWSKL